MKRLLLIALFAFALLAPAALASGPTTVGAFHRLPEKQRRQIAIRFMTHHPVGPCAHQALTKEQALNLAPIVADDVRPGHDAADGSYISPGTALGVGIRHILANIGC